MTGRTYTFDADLCDAWASERSGKSSNSVTDNAVLGAIKAQQPKPRISWKPGLKVRRKYWPKNQFLTCSCGPDRRRDRWFVAWDHYVHKGWPGFDGGTGEFDASWEVVE